VDTSGSVDRWGLVAERAVSSVLVVVLLPVADNDSGLAGDPKMLMTKWPSNGVLEHGCPQSLRSYQPCSRVFASLGQQGSRDGQPKPKGCSANFGAEGDVEAGAVAGQPHQQDAGPFEDPTVRAPA
jgi:hypothetical protein